MEIVRQNKVLSFRSLIRKSALQHQHEDGCGRRTGRARRLTWGRRGGPPGADGYHEQPRERLSHAVREDGAMQGQRYLPNEVTS